jgi:hypothetical protein
LGGCTIGEGHEFWNFESQANLLVAPRGARFLSTR